MFQLRLEGGSFGSVLIDLTALEARSVAKGFWVGSEQEVQASARAVNKFKDAVRAAVQTVGKTE